MRTAALSKIERLARPLIRRLPPKQIVRAHSWGRREFLEALKDELPETQYDPPKNLERELWCIKFRSPVMNAAGMFKDGECYEMAAKQGAGAYLGGTGTWNPRKGNKKFGIKLPFTIYPESHSASNWLGLPNDGDEINSKRVAQIKRIADCPIGWSVIGSPDLHGDDQLEYLVKGMKSYMEAGVDFLEINESCPNTSHGKPQEDDLASRLEYIKKNFLDKRQRNIPVIVKFSNDTEVEQLPALLDLLFELGFDGVNFGNTSTDYEQIREMIHSSEILFYDYYTQTFGGGISGRPLNKTSLELASRAAEYKKQGGPSQEFHVTRTGGIETWQDIQDSLDAGISLCHWYTGYFHNFGKHGHGIYKELFKGIE